MWLTSARDVISGEQFEIRSRAVINACGPWVDAQNRIAGEQTQYHHVFSKGVHLVVDKITDNKRVLTFFASDGRLFFLIPMGPKTCIGTTDTQVDTPDGHGDRCRPRLCAGKMPMPCWTWTHR